MRPANTMHHPVSLQHVRSESTPRPQVARSPRGRRTVVDGTPDEMVRAPSTTRAAHSGTGASPAAARPWALEREPTSSRELTRRQSVMGSASPSKGLRGTRTGLVTSSTSARSPRPAERPITSPPPPAPPAAAETAPSVRSPTALQRPSSGRTGRSALRPTVASAAHERAASAVAVRPHSSARVSSAPSGRRVAANTPAPASDNAMFDRDAVPSSARRPAGARMRASASFVPSRHVGHSRSGVQDSAPATTTAKANIDGGARSALSASVDERKLRLAAEAEREPVPSAAQQSTPTLLLSESVTVARRENAPPDEDADNVVTSDDVQRGTTVDAGRTRAVAAARVTPAAAASLAKKQDPPEGRNSGNTSPRPEAATQRDAQFTLPPKSEHVTPIDALSATRSPPPPAAPAAFAPPPRVSPMAPPAALPEDELPDEEIEVDGFSPPMYLQRSMLCLQTLKRYRCYNFIDAGCADGRLLQYVVRAHLVEHSFRNVVGIDLSAESLKRAEACLPMPSSNGAQYLHRVRVELVQADLTLPPPAPRVPATEETSATVSASELAAACKPDGAGETPMPEATRRAEATPWLAMDCSYALCQTQRTAHRGSSASLGRGSGAAAERSSLAEFNDSAVGGAAHVTSTRVQPMDAVVSLEVLQCMPPHLVAEYTDTVFAQLGGQRGVRTVLLTTPNRLENGRLDEPDRYRSGDEGRASLAVPRRGQTRSVFCAQTGQPRRRHDEHYFELTPAQFKAYCDYVIAYYSPYWHTYERVSLGEDFTQGAVFVSADAVMEQQQQYQPSVTLSRSMQGSFSAVASAVSGAATLGQSTRSRSRVESMGAAGLSAEDITAPPRLSMGCLSDAPPRADGSVSLADDLIFSECAPGEYEDDYVAHTQSALQRGRGINDSLRRRIATKAAAASAAAGAAESVRRKRHNASVSAARGKAKSPASATGRGRGERGAHRLAGGRRGVSSRGPREHSEAAARALSLQPAGNDDDDGSANAAEMGEGVATRPVRLPPPLTLRKGGSAAADDDDDDDDDDELEDGSVSFGSPAPGAVRRGNERFEVEADGALFMQRTHLASSWTYDREERLQSFPFEAVFGMTRQEYDAEFADTIATIAQAHETAMAEGRTLPAVFEETEPDDSASPTSVCSVAVNPHNNGYLSVCRAVLPAVNLWDRLCDAVFVCAQNLYRDLLTACYTSRRHGGEGWGKGSSPPPPGAAPIDSPSTAALTRQGVLFGDLVLSRERGIAFAPFRCTVCALLTALETQRRTWLKALLRDLRRWFVFARTRRISPNSAFTMLSGLIHEVMPLGKHVTNAAAASWANSLTTDCVAIPNSAAHSALKKLTPKEQKEGAQLLLALRTSQSGVRVHAWLLDEVTRLGIAQRKLAAGAAASASPAVTSGGSSPSALAASQRRVGGAEGSRLLPTARGATAVAATADDVLRDDDTRVDQLLPEEVCLTILFMAAVDAVPKAVTWLKERVPRWTGEEGAAASRPAGDTATGGRGSHYRPDAARDDGRRGSIAGAPAGMTSETDGIVPPGGRRRSIHRRSIGVPSSVPLPSGATTASPRQSVGSEGYAVAPASAVAAQLCSSFAAFRLDSSVLELLLGPPEDYIIADW